MYATADTFLSVVKYQINSDKLYKKSKSVCIKCINKHLPDLTNFSYKHKKTSDRKVIYTESVLITCYIRYREKNYPLCILCLVLAMFLKITKICCITMDLDELLG